MAYTSLALMWTSLPRFQTQSGFGAMPGGLTYGFDPKTTWMTCGSPASKPKAVTRRTCHDLPRRKRNSSRSSSNPVSGATISTATTNAGTIVQPLLDAQGVVDGQREERLRAERQVEHARRLERQHEPERDERVDATRRYPLGEVPEQIVHGALAVEPACGSTATPCAHL